MLNHNDQHMYRALAVAWPLSGYGICALCVPGMGNWYRRYHIIPEGANLRQLTDELVKPVSKSQSLPRT